MDVQHEPWLSVAAAAHRRGCSTRTVRIALETGELHGHQPCFRGRWTIRTESVDAWIRGESSASACGCSEIARRRHRLAG